MANLTMDMIIKHTMAMVEELNAGDFPVKAFPETIQKIINGTNDALKYPLDFTACAMLYAASAVIGNSVKIRVNNTWIDGTTIYMALVGRPGTNKTHPLNFALSPILQRDRANFKKYEGKREEYKHELIRAKAEGEEPAAKPFWQRTVVSDFTPEALSEIHRYNSRGLAVYSDELNGWLKNFNRYSRGNETEFWLSNFSGTQITVDRKSSEPIVIPYPMISVCGSIQPAILNELKRDNKNENGFIDRILFAYPDNLKKEYWSETELPANLIESWERIINNLMSLPLKIKPDGELDPMVLDFTPEAKDKLMQWQRKNTDAANEIENEQLAGVYSKFEIYCVRLSLILEMMCWATCENANNARNAVNANAVDGAIRLIEYFRSTATRVNGILSQNPVEGLDKRKRDFYNALHNEFNTDEGLAIAKSMDFAERTYKRFLNENVFFEKLEHGKYRKKF
jgi:hypothetical protein